MRFNRPGYRIRGGRWYRRDGQDCGPVQFSGDDVPYQFEGDWTPERLDMLFHPERRPPPVTRLPGTGPAMIGYEDRDPDIEIEKPLSEYEEGRLDWLLSIYDRERALDEDDSEELVKLIRKKDRASQEERWRKR